MDTSETYIKMCEKAEEMQNDWQPKTADFYCYASKIHTIRNYLADQVKTSGDIWLPRQDQLQEMVDGWWKKNGSYGQPLIKGLYDFAMSYGPQPFKEDDLPISSWEQLWLAFVMKEKYNKVWNGDVWEISS